MLVSCAPLDPDDDFMLCVAANAHRLFESPPRPPQLRIVHSRRQLNLLHSPSLPRPQRGRGASSLHATWPSQAEDMVDSMLENSASQYPLPGHIVEYVERAGLAPLRRQWLGNQKAAAKLMLVEAGIAQRAATESSRDHTSTNLVIQLAAEQLLRLVAMVGRHADGADTEGRAGGFQHDRPLELIASCACADCAEVQRGSALGQVGLEWLKL